MKLKYSVALLSTMIFSFSLTCLSQAEQITQTQFSDRLYAAYKASEKVFPRRETSKQEDFENGKNVSSYTVISEFQSADVRRVFTKSVYKGSVDTNEMMQIGNDYFCRTNNGKWKKDKQFCGVMRISSMPVAEKESFTLNSIKEYESEVVFLEHYRTHKWKGPKENVATEYFFYDKYWLNPDLILQREKTDGKVLSHGVALPKIEPPIKPAKINSRKRTSPK